MIDLDLNDRQVDIIEDGFDLVIRIGQLPDSSLIARRLAPIHLLACASPEYLAKQGMPEQPTDLLHHQFLAYSNTNKNRKFYDDQGNSYEVSPTPSLRANNGDVLMESAIQGHGITILPTFILHKEIKKGRLVPVMTKYKAPSLSAYAIYPNNRFLSSKVRHMIDFLATKLEGIPYWDKDCG